MPLALRLLAGYIVKDLERQGDISLAIRFNPLDRLIPRKHNILDLAYNALGAAEKNLLSRISAFRSPVSLVTIRSVIPSEDRENIEPTLRTLMERGLVMLEPQRSLFDLHPIVRAYSYNRLRNKKGVHKILVEYFSGRCSTTSAHPECLEAAMPVGELLFHSVKAELYNEAFQLYKQRLYVLEALSVFQTEIDILSLFLMNHEEGTSHLTDLGDRCVLYNNLARAYGYVGKPTQAVRFCDLVRKLTQQAGGDQLVHLTATSNMGLFLCQMGGLVDAEQYERGVLSTTKRGSTFFEHLLLGLIYSYLGRYFEALVEFEHCIQRGMNNIEESFLFLYRTKRARLLGDIVLSSRTAQRALHLARVTKQPRMLIRAQSSIAAVMLVAWLDSLIQACMRPRIV